MTTPQTSLNDILAQTLEEHFQINNLQAHVSENLMTELQKLGDHFQQQLLEGNTLNEGTQLELPDQSCSVFLFAEVIEQIDYWAQKRGQESVRLSMGEPLNQLKTVLGAAEQELERGLEDRNGPPQFHQKNSDREGRKQ